MPNFDKTGPRGDGPLTGRGMGRCGSRADYDGPGRGYGRGRGSRGRGRGWGGGGGGWGRGGGWGHGAGWGWGRGGGWGWGRGGGWGWGRGPTRGYDEPWAAEEQAVLLQRKEALQAELAATDDRLAQLKREFADDPTGDDSEG